MIDKIATTATSYTNNIVEIGPGCGVLTMALLQHNAHVVAVEIDPQAMGFLEEYLGATYPHLTLLHGDALEVDFTPVLQSFPANTDNHRNHRNSTDHNSNNSNLPCLVSNLPYNISTKIFTRLTSQYGHLFQSAVLMFQKEVAQRLTATPNNKNYSSLSVFTQYYYNVRKVVDVSGSQFWPRANVLSTVLVFDRKPTLPLPPEREDSFFQMVRTCFTQKRKTLRNNLKNTTISGEQLTTILQSLNLSPSIRAEQLTLSDFLYIFEHQDQPKQPKTPKTPKTPVNTT